jgi:hypothetical protein
MEYYSIKFLLTVSPPDSKSFDYLECIILIIMSRRIAKIFPPPTVPEGKGASVIRIIGTTSLN